MASALAASLTTPLCSSLLSSLVSSKAPPLAHSSWLLVITAPHRSTYFQAPSRDRGRYRSAKCGGPLRPMRRPPSLTTFLALGTFQIRNMRDANSPVFFNNGDTAPRLPWPAWCVRTGHQHRLGESPEQERNRAAQDIGYLPGCCVCGPAAVTEAARLNLLGALLFKLFCGALPGVSAVACGGFRASLRASAVLGFLFAWDFPIRLCRLRCRISVARKNPR